MSDRCFGLTVFLEDPVEDEYTELIIKAIKMNFVIKSLKHIITI